MLEKVLRIFNFIHEKGTVYKILLACLISVFTSCLLFGVPWLGSCQPCPPGALEACPTIGRSGNYKKFQCPSGHYNDLASLIFNINDDAIKNLFSRNTETEFQHSSVLLFFIICYLLSILSYGVVLPAGFFVPVIVTGASYGQFVGMLVGSHLLYAVLGAASFLGGSMRMTVSLCVILLELTNNLLLLPLTMLVLLISKTVADTFNGNIYDLIMKAKGFPYLEAHAEPYMRQLTVGDVVTGPLRMFHGIEIGNIVHVLRITRHNGFPVIDEPPESESQSQSQVLYGLILRSHLIELLKKKEAFMSTPVERDASEALAHFSAAEFTKRGSGNGDSIDDIEITDEEMEMYLDLHPFTNASPYTVVETMSLAKALLLFRQVGLRHLLVIPKITNNIYWDCIHCCSKTGGRD